MLCYVGRIEGQCKCYMKDVLKRFNAERWSSFFMQLLLPVCQAQTGCFMRFTSVPVFCWADLSVGVEQHSLWM